MNILSVAVAGLLLVGCYTLEPTGGVVPEVGMGIALDLNDAGRVALGGSMGPEIARIEGQLLSKDTEDYFVAVRTVYYLRGGEQEWRGEKVHIKPQYVSMLYERRFSRGRTLAVGAAALGAVALLAGQKLFGSGTGTPDPNIPHDTGQSVRIPRF